MAAQSLPVLYIKPGCPWCVEVVSFLREQGVAYREQDVNADAAARAEMLEKSGQTKVPTMDWHGKILADFGVDELVPFLNAQGLALKTA